MGAAALPIAAIAVGAGGKIMEGVAANKQARAAARVDEENARLTQLQGEQEGLQSQIEERSMAGDLLAVMGGSGTMLTGSNADVLLQSAFQREQEIANIRTQRSAEARNLMAEAKAKRKQGRNALISAGFSALSTALGGVADMRANRLLSAQGSRERASMQGGTVKLQGRVTMAGSGNPANAPSGVKSVGPTPINSGRTYR